MVDQKSDNSLGNGIIDILLDHVEIGHDESLYHVCFSLLSEFRIVVDFDHSWY